MGACCCSRTFGSEKVEPPLSIQKNPENTPKTSIQHKSSRSLDIGKSGIYQEAASAVRNHQRKSRKDKVQIVSLLKGSFLFVDSSAADLGPFVEAMSMFTFRAWKTVMEEGQIPQFLFILAYGRIELSCQGKFRSEIGPGGDLNLSSAISGTPWPVTATTVEPSGLWALDKATFHELLRTFEQTEAQRLKSVLDTDEVFLNLLPEQKESLYKVIEIVRLEENTVVVEQNSAGDSCFMIMGGRVACSRNGMEIRRLGPGELFGEQVLLYGRRRTASVRSITPTVLWKIERETAMRVLAGRLDHLLYRNSIRIAFDREPVLSRLSHKHQDKLIASMHLHKYLQGEIGLTSRPGELFFVLQGRLQSTSDTKSTLDTFSIVGNLLECKESYESNSENYIVTSEFALIASLNTILIEHHMQNIIATAIGKLPTLYDLRQVSLCLGVKDSTLQQLLKAAVVRLFSRDEVIISENDRGNSIYVIASGEVEVTQQGRYVRSLGNFDYFGERAVLLNTCRTATVTSKTDTLCWTFDRSHLPFLLSDSVIKDRLTARTALQDDPVTLTDLVVTKQTSKKYPGNSLLVVHSTTFKFYVLQFIDKSRFSPANLRDFEAEKKLRESLYHHFIETHVKTLEEEKGAYMLSEYCNGSDLYGLLKNIGRVLTEEEAKFYLSCLILAVEYLHSRQIALRYLEPANILIDSNGYPRICGLEYAKKLSEKTVTTISAPHYLAPEVIKRHGYGVSVDYWSLGVLLYEFLYGKVPFGEEETDPMEIYNEILTRELTFSLLSEQVVEVLHSLLERQPARRAKGSLSKLKKMPWFKGVDWVSATQEGLLLQQCKPPYTPETKDLKELLATALATGETVKYVINVPSTQKPLVNKRTNKRGSQLLLKSRTSLLS